MIVVKKEPHPNQIDWFVIDPKIFAQISKGDAGSLIAQAKPGASLVYFGRIPASGVVQGALLFSGDGCSTLRLSSNVLDQDGNSLHTAAADYSAESEKSFP